MRHFFCAAIFAVLATQTTQAEFLPKADLAKLAIPADGIQTKNFSQAEFNTIIERVQKLYEREVSQFGGKLQIRGDWNSEKLNAGANQLFGNWSVVITGGLARHPKLTLDGFTLILCHEMGHHLGGYAFAPSPNPIIPTWAANEGQADYFATQSCARRLWEAELDQNSKIALTATEEMRTQCAKAWSTENEMTLCLRSLIAVDSLIATMAAIKEIPMPSFATPEPKQVDKIDSNHPHPQCRMDTSLQAALCKQSFNTTIIPGRKATGGVTSEAAEREGAAVSCTQLSGYSLGLRPRCWFFPRM